MNASSSAETPLGKSLLAACRSILTDLFRPYRPERHYMRGPGPKWREKNTITHIVVRPDRSMRGRPARIRVRV
ncbi:hypothetical protein PQJ75_17815 [Rhodoplanes sp. TEM]|uniref:Uncharacterized protein n=1 Tax=Rhodoplanes tepidamans TaxID=200616 RepID=A0ABT5JKQ8_RHOTP|nr:MULTISPECIES: hypothetical protein [Rhodoplanes]MDC7789888.1 hypothetical protein [Rhodoplanes tepidamans]MDC7985591.1 hypothetical protein [Rhodoplanes sp. TEM]MDQ0358782.1 hypothetical protein [Rhodoplanes tepidamans]